MLIPLVHRAECVKNEPTGSKDKKNKLDSKRVLDRKNFCK